MEANLLIRQRKKLELDSTMSQYNSRIESLQVQVFRVSSFEFRVSSLDLDLDFGIGLWNWTLDLDCDNILVRIKPTELTDWLLMLC